MSFLEIQKQQLDIDNIDEEMDNDENYGLVQENSNVDKEQANGINRNNRSFTM